MPKTINQQRKKECQAFIKNHLGKLTRPEISAKLDISISTLKRFVNELGLGRNYQKTSPRKIRGKYFNVDSHQDWIVGKQ